MTPQEIYEIWAPAESVWSKWAKPVIFVEMAGFGKRKEQEDSPGEVVLEPDPNLNWVNGYRTDTAIVVSLPAERSVEMGMLLAVYGFRPVPLYNCTDGPQPVVNVTPI